MEVPVRARARRLACELFHGSESMGPDTNSGLHSLEDIAASFTGIVEFWRWQDARENDARAKQEGQGRRQGSKYAGRRVCSRRNRAHPPGQARGQEHQAGDCDWVIEGPSGRGKTWPSQARSRIRADAQA